MKKKIILISGYTVLIDQILKYMVSKAMINKTIVPNLLSFIYLKNKGVAFSALSNHRIFIIIASIILLGILIYYAKNDKFLKDENVNVSLGYGLLFGGIIGNLIDRIIRGYVVDFISLKLIVYNFPVFNIADLAITCGVIIILIYNLKNSKVSK